MSERAREKKENGKGYVVAIALLSLLLLFSPLSSFAAVEEEYVEWDIPTDLYVPPIPTNLSHSEGNFYVNYTWEPDDATFGYTETDSYNLSYWINANHYWDNTTNTSLNHTTGAHGWLNISQLWAYNDSYTNLSDGYISQSVQIPNNPITITNTSGWTGDEDELVYLDFDYTDLDGDAGAFTTTSPKGSLNGATGVFEWQTTMADDGVYVWWFNVSDGYGSSDSYSATITVNDLGDLLNLTSWYNNYTCDNSTNFTIPHEDADNRTVFFNVTAEQNMNYWLWYVDGAEYQNSSVNNITKTWEEGGNKTVSVYGVNLNGKTKTLYWYITIEYTEYEYQKLIYGLNLMLLEENEMIGQTMLFSILLVIGFMFLLAGYLSPNGSLKIFGASFSSLLFFVLAYAVIGNQFGVKLQMGWLATLLSALGLVQAIFTLVLIISVLYGMFTTRRQAGMDAIPYAPDDRSW